MARRSGFVQQWTPGMMLSNSLALKAGDDVIALVQRPQNADDYKDIVEIVEIHGGDKLTQNLTRR
jgi:hypothetical protein